MVSSPVRGARWPLVLAVLIVLVVGAAWLLRDRPGPAPVSSPASAPPASLPAVPALAGAPAAGPPAAETADRRAAPLPPDRDRRITVPAVMEKTAPGAAAPVVSTITKTGREAAGQSLEGEPLIVRGRVTFPDRLTPYPGAAVIATNGHDRRVEGLTDDEGRFVLTGVPLVDPLAIVIFSRRRRDGTDEYPPLMAWLVLPEDCEIVEVPQVAFSDAAWPGVFRGRVEGPVSPGTGWAALDTLDLSPQGAGRIPIAADGTFTIAGLSSGSYEIGVVVEGMVPQSRTFTISDAALEAQGDFALVPATPWELQVRDAGGAPVASYGVRMTSLDPPTLVTARVTDAEGRARFPLAADATVVYEVSAEGFASAYAVCEVRASPRAEVVLTRGGRFTVQLRDGDGPMTMPFRLELFRTDLPAFAAPIHRLALCGPDGTLAPPAPDETGYFEVGPLAPGEYRWDVAPFRTLGRPIDFSIREGEVTALGTLPVESGATVSGVVTRAAGALPALAARAYTRPFAPEPARGAINVPRAGVDLDPAGRFVLSGLPEGETWIRLEDGTDAVWAERRLTLGRQDRQTIEFHLPK